MNGRPSRYGTTDMAKRASWFITLICILGLIGCETPSISASSQCSVWDEQGSRDVTRKEVRQIQQRAEAGDSEAQYWVAEWYATGFCLTQDVSIALDWYERAAEQGHLEAQYETAWRYMWGTGVAKDVGRGKYWYQKAAEQGHARSARALGGIYHQDEKMKDLDEAEKWYSLAVRLDDEISQQHLDSVIKEKDPAAWARIEQERAAELSEEERKYQEQQRLKAEARASADAQENERRLQALAIAAQEKERRRQARVKAAQEVFGTIGISVIPFNNEVTIEQPRKKKLERASGVGGGGGAGGLEYLIDPSFISTGVVLGLMAGAVVVSAISAVTKKQLSDEEKQEIETAAENLQDILSAPTIERKLRQKIIEFGDMSSGYPLYNPITFQTPDLGPGSSPFKVGISCLE